MDSDKKQVKMRGCKFGILIKKYFVTGLVAIIPIWITFFIVAVLFKLVSNFAFPIVNYFVADRYWVHVIARFFSFFISVISIIILGFVANRVFGQSVLNSIEKLIEKLPILSTVHSTAKQFVNFIFCKDSSKNFKRVIFVPYPTKEIYSVAFLTGQQSVKGENYICAFMPTTPNPTSGFLLLFREGEIVYTDYTIEQAFRFIISVGVVCMDKSGIQKENGENKNGSIKKM
jgi:uncharacterized membrane protein